MNPFIIPIVLLLYLPLFSKEKPTVHQLFSVQTIKVKTVSSSLRENNYGFVKADQSRTYEITPRFSGYVVKLHANKIYKKVKKGDPLVTVYSPEVLKAKDEYINSYRYANSGSNKGMLASAKRKLELLNISPREIEDVVNKKISRTTSTIYAPVDGYIFSKNISNGSAFTQKQKLFTLVNLDKVWVEVKLHQHQLQRIQNADLYRVKAEAVLESFESSQSFLYPNLDIKEALITLRIDVDNKEHKLFPGMYTKVERSTRKEELLILPSTAVIRKNGLYYVFVVGEYEGEYNPLEVKVKVLDNDNYIIQSGLLAGEEVVNNALFMMDSDAQINSLY